LRTFTVLSFISQVFGYSFYFLTSFILVRLLGKFEFGVFQKFNLLLTSALPFFGLTLVSSLYYFHSIYENEKDRSNLFNQTFTLLSFSGLVFFLIFSVWKDQVLVFLNLVELKNISVFIFLAILFYLNSSICDNIFLLDKNRKAVLFFLPFEKLLFLILILIAYKFSIDFYDIFYGFLFFSIFKFFFTVAYLQKKHGLLNYRINFQNIIVQAKYCIPFFLGTIIYIVSNKFDKFLLNQYVSPSEYAIYSVTFLSIPFLANAYNSVNNVVLPEFTNLLQKGEKNELKNLYQNIVIKSASIAIPIIYFFFFCSPFIIEVIFTKTYISADLYYKIGLFSFLISMTSYGLILRATNQTKLIFKINLIAGLISIIVGFIIIPKYLLLGAVLTSVLAVVLPGVFQLIYEIRSLDYSFSNFFPIKKFLTILITGGVIYPIFIFSNYLVENLFVQTLTIGFLYFPLIYFFMLKMNYLPFKDKIAKIKWI
jgi:O-antigen/teichoic acid export membrane protein